MLKIPGINVFFIETFDISNIWAGVFSTLKQIDILSCQHGDQDSGCQTLLAFV